MAGIAGRLHSPARRLFLSLGIVAGVLAMRLLLPPAAVAVGGATDPATAVDAAVFAPGSFSAHLAEVRPALAAFVAASPAAAGQCTRISGSGTPRRTAGRSSTPRRWATRRPTRSRSSSSS
ncbi:hypothetical protein C1N91_07595 [Curtobacterium sp. SGAir0471]|nr:hypothetical protein C1N91_07595 [Curtobacterium sp. SGAir0471]